MPPRGLKCHHVFCELSFLNFGLDGTEIKKKRDSSYFFLPAEKFSGLQSRWKQPFKETLSAQEFPCHPVFFKIRGWNDRTSKKIKSCFSKEARYLSISLNSAIWGFPCFHIFIAGRFTVLFHRHQSKYTIQFIQCPLSFFSRVWFCVGDRLLCKVGGPSPQDGMVGCVGPPGLPLPFLPGGGGPPDRSIGVFLLLDLIFFLSSLCRPKNPCMIFLYNIAFYGGILHKSRIFFASLSQTSPLMDDSGMDAWMDESMDGWKDG